MYYKQSFQILERIKSSKNILVNIHKNPDLDSIGCACALVQSINRLNKNVTIIASEDVESSLLIFPETKKIKIIDYMNYDFSKYDLFIIADSSSYDRVTGSKKILLPRIPIIIIDHHHFNSIESNTKLVDTKASATCEIIYKLLVDWKIKIDKNMATILYSGIASDTVFFKYSADITNTFLIAADLLEKRADHQYIIDQFYDNVDFKFVKLIGLFLEQMKIKKTKLNKHFVFSAISHEQFIKYGQAKGAREAAADSFFRSIKGVDFGLAIVEAETGILNISFRSKLGTDVSVLAKALGGGGHTNAAGATIEGEFKKTLTNIIKKIVAMS